MPIKKKLDAYRGKLTPTQVAQGINAASANALRLAEDAETLLEVRRFPTAASLAILSIEESGKTWILRSLALARTSDEASDAWKSYRSHTRKNAFWLLPQLVTSGSRKLADFEPLFREESEHPYLLDQIKQLGFYTDCLGKAHWSVPLDVIDEELARTLVRVARTFAKRGEHSVEEIELWVKYIGPVWKKDPKSMNQALVRWYAAMQEAGLMPQGANAMEEFICGPRIN